MFKFSSGFLGGLAAPYLIKYGGLIPWLKETCQTPEFFVFAAIATIILHRNKIFQMLLTGFACFIAVPSGIAYYKDNKQKIDFMVDVRKEEVRVACETAKKGIIEKKEDFALVGLRVRKKMRKFSAKSAKRIQRKIGFLKKKFSLKKELFNMKKIFRKLGISSLFRKKENFILRMIGGLFFALKKLAFLALFVLKKLWSFAPARFLMKLGILYLLTFLLRKIKRWRTNLNHGKGGNAGFAKQNAEQYAVMGQEQEEGGEDLVQEEHQCCGMGGQGYQEKQPKENAGFAHPIIKKIESPPTGISPVLHIGLLALLIGVPHYNLPRFVSAYQYIEKEIVAGRMTQQYLKKFRDLKGYMLLPGEKLAPGAGGLENVAARIRANRIAERQKERIDRQREKRKSPLKRQEEAEIRRQEEERRRQKERQERNKQSRERHRENLKKIEEIQREKEEEKRRREKERVSRMEELRKQEKEREKERQEHNREKKESQEKNLKQIENHQREKEEEFLRRDKEEEKRLEELRKRGKERERERQERNRKRKEQQEKNLEKVERAADEREEEFLKREEEEDRSVEELRKQEEEREKERQERNRKKKERQERNLEKIENYQRKKEEERRIREEDRDRKMKLELKRRRKAGKERSKQWRKKVNAARARKEEEKRIREEEKRQKREEKNRRSKAIERQKREEENRRNKAIERQKREEERRRREAIERQKRREERRRREVIEQQKREEERRRREVIEQQKREEERRRREAVEHQRIERARQLREEEVKRSYRRNSNRRLNNQERSIFVSGSTHDSRLALAPNRYNGTRVRVPDANGRDQIVDHNRFENGRGRGGAEQGGDGEDPYLSEAGEEWRNSNSRANTRFLGSFGAELTKEATYELDVSEKLVEFLAKKSSSVQMAKMSVSGSKIALGYAKKQTFITPVAKPHPFKKGVFVNPDGSARKTYQELIAPGVEKAKKGIEQAETNYRKVLEDAKGDARKTLEKKARPKAILGYGVGVAKQFAGGLAASIATQGVISGGMTAINIVRGKNDIYNKVAKECKESLEGLTGNRRLEQKLRNTGRKSKVFLKEAIKEASSTEEVIKSAVKTTAGNMLGKGVGFALGTLVGMPSIGSQMMGALGSSLASEVGQKGVDYAELGCQVVGAAVGSFLPCVGTILGGFAGKYIYRGAKRWLW